MATKEPTATTSAPLVTEDVTPSSVQGATYETATDPAREAYQKAAVLDYQIRQNPGGWARLGNGAAVKIQPGMPFKYPGEETHAMLDHPGGIWKIVNGHWHLLRDQNNEPTTILLEPKPPFYFGGVESHRYGWFVRTAAVRDDQRPAQTASYHRQEKIRYVETKEIDKSSPVAVYEEYATPNNTYVTTGTMILAEIMKPGLSYQKYKGWTDQAIQRVVDVAQTVQSSPSVMTDSGPVTTHVTDKTVTKVDGPTDVKRGG